MVDAVAFFVCECFVEDVVEAFWCSADDEVAVWFCEH